MRDNQVPCSDIDHRYLGIVAAIEGVHEIAARHRTHQCAARVDDRPRLSSAEHRIVRDDLPWNFDYAVLGASSQFFSLFIDLDPMLATNYFRFNFTGNNHDSSNLGYFGPLFDNNVDGQYSFRLEEYTNTDRVAVVSRAEIEVVAGHGAAPLTATPEPATIGLLATGLIGLGGFVRRRRTPVEE